MRHQDIYAMRETTLRIARELPGADDVLLTPALQAYDALLDLLVDEGPGPDHGTDVQSAIEKVIGKLIYARVLVPDDDCQRDIRALLARLYAMLEKPLG